MPARAGSPTILVRSAGLALQPDRPTARRAGARTSAPSSLKRVEPVAASGAIEVRLARAVDAEAIRTIYNAEVTGSTVTFDMVPRTLEEQLAWLASHDGAHPAIVATGPSGRIVGFGSLSPYRPRPAYRTTVEDSVYVDRALRGAGVGRILLEELVSLAQLHGFHAVMARIVGGHETSIGLHRSCGFELVGIEREVGRKFGKWLDVALMQCLI